MAARPRPPESPADLARSLGPTAFTALVVLAADAERQDDGRLVVAVSARSLASRLGVGKDAAARALRRLAAAGLLDEAPQGKADTGRFAAAARALRPPPGLGPCPHCGDAAAVPALPPRRGGSRAVSAAAGLGPCPHCGDAAAVPALPPRRGGSRAVSAAAGQLDLFDAAGGDDRDGEQHQCLTSRTHPQNQVHRIQSPSLPSLITQTLRLTDQSIQNHASSSQTRLHQGCGDVAGDVATAPREAPEARPC